MSHLGGRVATGTHRLGRVTTESRHSESPLTETAFAIENPSKHDSLTLPVSVRSIAWGHLAHGDHRREYKERERLTTQHSLSVCLPPPTVQDWAGRSEDEFHRELVIIKLKCSKKRSFEQEVMLRGEKELRRLLRRRHGHTTPTKCLASNPHWLHPSTFSYLHEEVCEAVNARTGEWQTFSLYGHLEGGHFVERSLVLLGASEAGKSCHLSPSDAADVLTGLDNCGWRILHKYTRHHDPIWHLCYRSTIAY